MKWWKIGLLGAVLVGGVWLYTIATQPVPGQKFESQGRDHVTPAEVAAYKYNTNPPTSGPHLATWVKPETYTQPQQDGELIHSLEHGYVIISYDCNIHLISQKSPSERLGTRKVKSNLITQVFAHDEGEEGASPAAELDLPPVATGSAINESEACKTLIKQLEELAKKNRLWKLIVVPQPNLETTIALTAWEYIDTFDDFDAARIERFINYHRDHGPEKTME